MNKDNQQQLDDFLKSAFKKNIEREIPKYGFSDRVLSQLNKPQVKVTISKPLVFSKKIKWTFGLSIFIMLLVSLLFSLNSPEQATYQLPADVINIFQYFTDFFMASQSLFMVISAATVGFWSLMLLDKIIQRFSFA